MNIHSKVSRSAFVIFSVLVCGGWYSDSRANQENVNYISEFFVSKVGEERNTNTVQNGQQGKLILAQKQGKKRNKRWPGVSKGKVTGPPHRTNRGRTTLQTEGTLVPPDKTGGKRKMRRPEVSKGKAKLKKLGEFDTPEMSKGKVTRPPQRADRDRTPLKTEGNVDKAQMGWKTKQKNQCNKRRRAKLINMGCKLKLVHKDFACEDYDLSLEMFVNICKAGKIEYLCCR